MKLGDKATIFVHFFHCGLNKILKNLQFFEKGYKIKIIIIIMKLQRSSLKISIRGYYQGFTTTTFHEKCRAIEDASLSRRRSRRVRMLKRVTFYIIYSLSFCKIECPPGDK